MPAIAGDGLALALGEIDNDGEIDGETEALPGDGLGDAL